jgi:26S proteasome regulatory subunit N10
MAFNNMKVHGDGHFTTSIKIAWLALKHRVNKHQKQRIVIFVSSPVTETEKSLVKLGKKLRKNAIAIDVILLGAVDEKLGQVGEEQVALLKKFVETANSGDNCNFCHFQGGGVNTLSDDV